MFRSFPGMDHLYLRLAWSYLEPEEGKYDWHLIDDIVTKYVPLGYKIAFRITSDETGPFPDYVGQEKNGIQYATPAWVAMAGAKGTVTGRRIKSWVPQWDDPVYLEKLNNFHKAFAARYDGQPWVIYLDIGSVGDWGEGHTSSTTNIPPTVREVKANTDIYLKNYKKSQLVSCDDLCWFRKSDDDAKTLYDYMINNGITFRDDSPLVNWYVETFPWSVSHPHFYNPLYLKKPVIFESGHYNAIKKDGLWLGKNGAEKISKFNFSGAEIMRGAIQTMHATYIGYHGYAEEWLTENPDLARELANLCGYWYFPVNVSLPDRIILGENRLSFKWFNKGVAPAYNTFGIVLRFEQEKSGKSFDLFLNDSGNKNWLPGFEKSEIYFFKIPLETKKGNYILKFKLVEKNSDSIQDIQIGINANSLDPQNFLEIGRITVK